MDSKPKILVVDDKPENLLAIRVVLKDMEVELIEASNGNEALKLTLHHDFALALLDIQMPEMDGYELATILREEEKTAHLPFIFISAVYTDNQHVFKGYEKGAFSFITKPFQSEILINIVNFFIEKYHQEIDLQKKNTELENINKELEAFTYSVSHDLRAPLRVINGFTKIILKEYEQKMDEDGKELLNGIASNATKMNNLIDSLLMLSRLGKKEMKKNKVDMNLLLKEVMEEAEQEYPSKNLKVDLGDMLPVNGDTELLRQVFLNLISNAIKYSSKKEAPLIEIKSKQEGNEIIYSVKDNGAGFNMEYSSKLFGVFQRLHSDSEFEGIGIGLAIVQRIAFRHGGRVWAEGELNKGATFYVALPVK
jgi:two-component system sensor histidine kinase/response regulator